MPAYPADRHNGRTTPIGTDTGGRRWSPAQLRAWHMQVLRAAGAHAAHRTAGLLMNRAGRYGPSVYGSQVRLASLLGCAERTVRYHLQTLETLGLVKVKRCRPERDPATGKWSRRLSNCYVLTFPKSPDRPTGKPVPLRPLSGHTPTQPAASAGPAWVDLPPEQPPELARAALAAARAALRSASSRLAC